MMNEKMCSLVVSVVCYEQTGRNFILIREEGFYQLGSLSYVNSTRGVYRHIRTLEPGAAHISMT